jgi:NAD(P)-dependent dehydrogenase (short-subunit alcohol dehydrogenase family)
MENSLLGKIAVITGGSSGIGLAIAKRYVESSAKVVLAARDEAKLELAKKALGDSVDIFPCDVSNLSQLDQLYDFVKQQHGHIDILVANASVQFNLMVQDVTEENFDLVTDINYKGLYFTVQKGVKLMTKGGSVILMSSIAAHNGYQCNSVYAASKAATSQLGKNFAADLLNQKIRVNVISPGCIQTPLWDKVKKVIPDIVEKYSAALIPAERFGEPNEIAELAHYLVGPKVRKLRFPPQAHYLHSRISSINRHFF